MLNAKHIATLIRSRFPNLAQLGEQPIFRAEESHNNTAFSVFYFDCSDQLWKEKPNLKQYQDQLLSKDYYTHPGSLQWNFYLVFILSQEAYSQLPVETREFVEKDKVYTRKFVLQDTSLPDFLELPEGKSSANLEKIDPTSRWVARLDKSGLSEIYSKKNKTEVLENYYNGYKEDFSEIVSISDDSLFCGTGHISELVIDSYREYPKHRRFNFGSVNLIKGPNGTGKTSLLEAIELWHCGNTLRNETEAHKDYRLQIKLDGFEDYIDYQPSNPPLYKQRDLKWYGKPSGQRNTLHKSFNRYNFFNTDFAYHLANAKDLKNIEGAFTALALGDEANHIDKKLHDFRSSFVKEERDVSKNLVKVDTEIKSLNEKLKRLAKVDSRAERSFQDLKRLFDEENIQVPLESLAQYSQEGHQLTKKVRISLSQLIGDLDWLGSISLSEIVKKKEVIEQIIAEIDSKQEVVKVAEKRLRETQEKLEITEKRVRILRDAGPLFSDPKSFELVGSESKKIEIGKKKIVVEELLAELSKIDLDIIDNTTDKEKLTEKLSNLEQVIKDSEDYAIKMEKNLRLKQNAAEQIEALISDIKALGQKYLENDPEDGECPLCNAKYEIEELRHRVANSLDVNQNTAELVQLKKDIISIKDTIRKNKHAREYVKKALEFITRLKGVEIGTQDSVQGIKEAEKKLSDLNSRFEGEIREISEFINKYEANGVSESFIIQLSFDFEKEGIDLKLNPESTDYFGEELKAGEEGLADLQKTAKTFHEEINLSKKSQEELLKSVFEQVPANPSADLRRRYDALSNGERFLNENSKTLGLTDSTDIFRLEARLGLFIENAEGILETYAQEQRQFIEKESAEQSLNRQSEEKRELEQRLSKTKDALAVINDILDNDSKEKALSEFLSDYLKLITSVFRRIHSPKEFVDLNPKDLSLIRENGETAYLSSISTGQRSAFALSVFFSLNISANAAPPIILIDDPVAYVDDLNTLSFLDYLRVLAVKLNKQIFFATANDKLANLFEKKFEFLGPKNFKKFVFSRN